VSGCSSAEAICPTAGLLATAYALKNVYSSLVDDKPAQAPLYDFSEFSSLLAFRGVGFREEVRFIVFSERQLRHCSVT
jgi:hypothetical protein